MKVSIHLEYCVRFHGALIVTFRFICLMYNEFLCTLPIYERVLVVGKTSLQNFFGDYC